VNNQLSSPRKIPLSYRIVSRLFPFPSTTLATTITTPTNMTNRTTTTSVIPEVTKSIGYMRDIDNNSHKRNVDIYHSICQRHYGLQSKRHQWKPMMLRHSKSRTTVSVPCWSRISACRQHRNENRTHILLSQLN